MEPSISKSLRATFLVHLAVAAVLGLAFLLVPDWAASLYGLEVPPPFAAILRLVGAAMLGWGLSSWFGYKARSWESVRVVVAAETLWTLAGALVTVYSILFDGFPALGWLNAAIFGAFAVAFAWQYRAHAKDQE